MGLSEKASRPNVPRVCLVMTDGNSQARSKTAYQARLLRESGVHVWAMGYGNSISMEELVRIAGLESHAFLQKDIGNVISEMDTFYKAACCRRVAKPADPVCKSRSVHFVFSRVLLGESLTAKTVSLIRAMADKEKAANVSWGVASGSCRRDEGFAPTTNVIKRLNYYSRDHLIQTVQSLNKAGTLQTSQGTCSVVVLVVNKRRGLKNHVYNLREAGAEQVIIWNLSGTRFKDAEFASAINTQEPTEAAKVISREIFHSEHQSGSMIPLMM